MFERLNEMIEAKVPYLTPYDEHSDYPPIRGNCMIIVITNANHCNNNV